MNDERDAQILFYVFISIYNSLHVSSTKCSSSGETIVSIQPPVTVYVGGRDVCRLDLQLSTCFERKILHFVDRASYNDSW